MHAKLECQITVGKCSLLTQYRHHRKLMMIKLEKMRMKIFVLLIGWESVHIPYNHIKEFQKMYIHVFVVLIAESALLILVQILLLGLACPLQDGSQILPSVGHVSFLQNPYSSRSASPTNFNVYVAGAMLVSVFCQV